jgi:hypothetical protein
LGSSSERMGFSCETGPFPSVFKGFQGGVAAPLIKRSRSLAAQTGWFVISNKIRIATRAYKEATRPFTNHRVCAAEEREFFIEAQPPYQETAPVTPLSSAGIKLAPFLFAFGLDAGQLGYSLKTEGNELASPSLIDFEIACVRQTGTSRREHLNPGFPRMRIGN